MKPRTAALSVTLALGLTIPRSMLMGAEVIE